MIPPTVTFDGHALGDLFVVCDVSRPLMGSPAPQTVEVSGRSGVVFLGTRRASYSISLTLAAIDTTVEGMRSAFRELAGWLSVDEPKRLEFSDESGLWRYAVPSDAGDLEVLGGTNGRADVTFLVCDSFLHGSESSASSSSGVATVEIGGTLPTPLLIEASAASGTFAVTDESGNASRVAVGSTSKALAIDAGEGSVTVGGSAAMLTLDSDWLTLDPGTHTITRTGGSGEFTVSWEERWA